MKENRWDYNAHENYVAALKVLAVIDITLFAILLFVCR